MGVSALMWEIWGTHNDMVFEKNSSPFFMQVVSGELIGCGFGPYYNMEMRGKQSGRQAKRWKSSLWKYSPRTDGEAIINFSYDFP